MFRMLAWYKKWYVIQPKPRVYFTVLTSFGPTKCDSFIPIARKINDFSWNWMLLLSSMKNDHLLLSFIQILYIHCPSLHMKALRDLSISMYPLRHSKLSSTFDSLMREIHFSSSEATHFNHMLNDWVLRSNL